ncbi:MULTISPECIES: hypothetical protein [Natrialbaceae]|uniref:hypothetical protein n=1 Tax=Natrialbaceae TaxID=1644061 RepID=UPI00207C1427|nr:hypothetical protein [Natronococcus sp. CG52]
MGSVSIYHRVIGISLFYGIPVVGVLGVVVAAILDLTEYAILGTYLAVPMIIAPVLYNYNINTKSGSIKGLIDKRVLLSAFFISLSCAILLTSWAGRQNILIYLLLTLSGITIFGQIFHSNSSVPLILAQISLLSAIIIWSISLLPHFFVGGTDTIPHAWWISELLQGKSLDEAFGRFGEVYSAFAFWHILNAMIYNVVPVGLTPHQIMLVTNGLLYAVIPPLIYSITRRISTREIALVAALFTPYSTYFIDYGTYSISRSVVGLLLIVIFWLFINNPNKNISILLFVTIFSTIPYHAASAPFISVIIIGYYCISSLFSLKGEKSIPVPKRILFISGIFLLVYWMYRSPDIIEVLVLTFLGAFSSAPAASETAVREIDIVARYINYAHFSPIVLFIVLSSLVVYSSDIDNDMNPLLKVFVTIGLLSIAITAPGPTLILEQLGGEFNFERWGLYTIMFISIATAVSVVWLYQPSQNLILSGIVVMLVAFSMFGGVSTDLVSNDPAVKTDTHTGYLTSEETSAINHSGTYSNQSIHSDYVVARYLEFSQFTGQERLIQVNSQNSSLITDDTNALSLVRYGELNERPLKVYTTDDKEVAESIRHNSRYSSEARVWDNFHKQSNIYNSGNNTIYTKYT